MLAGEATIEVKMAIQYPWKYRAEQNWFTTTSQLKVKDQMAIDVPEFLLKADKQTHLYLLPLRARSKITTNKRATLRLGDSMQSVYDHASRRYDYKTTSNPILDIVNNE